MAIIETLLHYGSYLAAFYAFYVVAGMLAFGLFLRYKIYQKPRPQPVALRVQYDPCAGRESDSRSH
jgi:hypothetical protein